MMVVVVVMVIAECTFLSCHNVTLQEVETEFGDMHQ